jgi:hypothetical protein
VTGPKASAGWLIVIYRVPSKPSTVRVGVWKLAQALGGLPLQQSVYMFPDRPEVRVGLVQLRRRVEDGGGEMTLFEISDMAPEKARALAEGLNRLRDEEYAQIIEDCAAMAHRLDRKTEHGHFDRDDARDARDDYERMRERFDATVARDYFSGSRRLAAQEAVAECAKQVVAFIERVGAGVPAPGGVASEAASAAGGSKHMKEKEYGVYPTSAAVLRARAVLDSFEAGTLKIGGTELGTIAESTLMEIKYSDRNGKRCLEIEFEW